MQIYEIKRFFEKLRFAKGNDLTLGDIRLTISQQDEICTTIDTFIDNICKSHKYIANEIEAHPEDSIQDIMNDSFCECKVPLLSDRDYNIALFDWDTLRHIDNT